MGRKERLPSKRQTERKKGLEMQRTPWPRKRKRFFPTLYMAVEAYGETRLRRNRTEKKKKKKTFFTGTERRKKGRGRRRTEERQREVGDSFSKRAGPFC